MKKDDYIDYWVQIASYDLATAENLFMTGDYHWCLYIGHLSLEKLLKAVFSQKHEVTPPKTHDLLKLAKLVDLKLTEEQAIFYNRVNDFNIEARYPDEKLNFYKIATKEFTEKNFSRIKEEFKWIKSHLK
ncbi:MAG: HEPN domain-containing protein [Desulfobulbaceae bacterium]|nr:HEPN domain-containing protein [Candidatus Kapabacteria bacterium]MBS3999208.1 HEPN domain-containing protein [Desulfobulbaceae bacterium]